MAAENSGPADDVALGEGDSTLPLVSLLRGDHPSLLVTEGRAAAGDCAFSDQLLELAAHLNVSTPSADRMPAIHGYLPDISGIPGSSDAALMGTDGMLSAACSAQKSVSTAITTVLIPAVMPFFALTDPNAASKAVQPAIPTEPTEDDRTRALSACVDCFRDALVVRGLIDAICATRTPVAGALDFIPADFALPELATDNDSALTMVTALAHQIPGAPAFTVLRASAGLPGNPREELVDDMFRRRVPYVVRMVESENAGFPGGGPTRPISAVSLCMLGIQALELTEPPQAGVLEFARTVRLFGSLKCTASADAVVRGFREGQENRPSPETVRDVRNLRNYAQELGQLLQPDAYDAWRKAELVKKAFVTNFPQETADAVPPTDAPDVLLAPWETEVERKAVGKVYKRLLSATFRRPAELSWAAEAILDDVSEVAEGRRSEMLRAVLQTAVATQRAWERDRWGFEQPTDFDRLCAAFQTLETRGIVCRHNSDNTMSGTHSTMRGIVERLVVSGDVDEANVRGYLSYHSQDVDGVLRHGSLHLVYSGWTVAKKNGCSAQETETVGHSIVAALRKHGLVVQWSGRANRRIELIAMRWYRRLPENDVQTLLESLCGE